MSMILHLKGETEMNTNRPLWAILSAVLIICIGVIAYFVVPNIAVEAKSKDLVGSWATDISVVKQNAEFPGFITFFNDGNVITDEAPSLYETSGHGNWINTRTNQAAFTFVFLIGSSGPQYIKGTVSGIANYNPDTDQWTGPFTIILVDQDGNEVLSDTGMMTGSRIIAK
jgi:hypothetical protein